MHEVDCIFVVAAIFDGINTAGIIFKENVSTKDPKDKKHQTVME